MDPRSLISVCVCWGVGVGEAGIEKWFPAFLFVPVDGELAKQSEFRL